MEKITTTLFDLDGTLIPFDQEEFIKAYFYNLAKKFVPMGYDNDLLIKSIWAGTGSMVKNDGKITNQEAFKVTFSKLMQREYDEMEKSFLDFYANEFDNAKSTLQEDVDRSEFIKALKDKGVKVVLATNPIFPRVAVQTRLNWIGLKLEDFDYVTTFENSHYCKPNLDYYKEIFENIGSNPNESIMVGNNALEDMISGELGVKTYLVTDNLENPNKVDIDQFENGSFDFIAGKILEVI